MKTPALYRYELKKLFCARVSLIAMAGSVVLLALLAGFSIIEDPPISREAAHALEDRRIDPQLIEEMKPTLRYENGSAIFAGIGEDAKYRPIMDVVAAVTGKDIDLTGFDGASFYELRDRGLRQRMEIQGLSESDRAFWLGYEKRVRKPFVYHCHSGPMKLLKSFQAFGFFAMILSAVGLSGVFARETAERVNPLLLCSRYGRSELYLAKCAAGITWALSAALMVILSVLIPFSITYGMEGMGEMLQLAKPWSMLPWSIGQMLAVCLGVYLLAAVLFASVTLLLSVTTQNAMVVICLQMSFLLVDLFAGETNSNSTLQRLWSLRPNAVLMNRGFSDYRLIRLAGVPLLNYQAAPVLYAAIAGAALLIGRRHYRKLQVGR